MIRSSRLLAVGALVVSGGVHVAGIAAQWSPEVAEMEGGAPASVARLGDSFRDVVSGNPKPVSPDEIEPLEPEETRWSERPPVTDARAPEKTATAARVEETLPSQTETRTHRSAPATRQAVQPDRHTAQTPPTPIRPTTEPAQTLQADLTVAVPVEPAPAVSTITSVPAAPLTPITPAPAQTEQNDATTLAALPENETSPALSARPQKRPDDLKIPERAKPPAPKPRQTARKKPGSGQTNETRGTAQGQARAKAQSSANRTANTPAQAGNAAASNYPGLVMRKIQRRKPRTNIRGTAVVSFSIAPSGALASLSLTRSSGSAQLDKLALSAVRRAAPFPRPPAGAQRRFRLPVRGR